MRSALAVAITLTAALAACAADPTPTPTPSATPTPEPAEETPSPVAEPEGPECIEGAICEGPVAPGDYTSTGAGATVTFTIADEGWQGAPEVPEVGFGIFRDDSGGFAGLSVVSFDGEVFTDSCSPDATEEIDATASGFMTWLASVEGITAGEVTETTLGGQPALVMDLTSALPADCPDQPWLWLWVVPVFGDFHLVDGETARFWALDVDGETIIVAAEVDEGVDWDAFIEDLTPILDSMSISAGA